MNSDDSDSGSIGVGVHDFAVALLDAANDSGLQECRASKENRTFQSLTEFKEVSS